MIAPNVNAVLVDKDGKGTMHLGRVLLGLQQGLQAQIDALAALTNATQSQAQTLASVAALANEGVANIGAAAIALAWVTFAGDPSATDLPDGYGIVYKNLGTGKIYLGANMGGTLKKVELT